MDNMELMAQMFGEQFYDTDLLGEEVLPMPPESERVLASGDDADSDTSTTAHLIVVKHWTPELCRHGERFWVPFGEHASKETEILLEDTEARFLLECSEQQKPTVDGGPVIFLPVFSKIEQPILEKIQTMVEQTDIITKDPRIHNPELFPVWIVAMWNENLQLQHSLNLEAWARAVCNSKRFQDLQRLQESCLFWRINIVQHLVRRMMLGQVQLETESDKEEGAEDDGEGDGGINSKWVGAKSA